VKYSSKIYLKLITRDNNCHNKCGGVIAAFIYDFGTEKKYYYNFSHTDLAVDSTFEELKDELENAKYSVYVKNKKTYKYWIDCNLIDVNLFGFIENNEILEETSSVCKDHLQNNYHTIKDFNLIVPFVKHQECFDEEVQQIAHLNEKETDTYCFKFFNDVITNTLYDVEKNGLKIDTSLFKQHFKARTYDDYVYTNYNIYNPTGRPSNSYDNVNYVALKKDDGCRASFVSRYGNDGHLMMIDFTGFHPYIVANLVDYKVPEEETIYEHLAKQYYNTDSVAPELLSKAKKLTMVNLYGQISDAYIDIEYFKKTEELKNKYWDKFTNKGYVTTPIYKRKITDKHILGANKNKLFAYIIQAAETEYGIDSLSKCIKFVSNKKIVPILYVYDSIVFDIHNDADKQDILDLIEIFKNKRFKVKTYMGNNYNDLKLVQI
jgi:hypothetical protein